MKTICRGQCPVCKRSITVREIWTDSGRYMVFRPHRANLDLPIQCPGAGGTCTSYERMVSQ